MARRVTSRKCGFLKLLFIINSLEAGGAERVTTTLANHWAAKGCRVTVATLTSTSLDFYELHPAVQRVALDVAGQSATPWAAIVNNWQRVCALRRLLKQERADVALAMMSTANVLLALAAIGLPRLVAVGSERTYPPRIPLGRIWEFLRAQLYARLDAMVALTTESAEWLRQHTRASCVAVIPNAALWPLPLQAPHVSVIGKASGQHLLLAVGRLSEEKGFGKLIDAWQQLAADFPQWQLVILGEGPDRQALQAQAAALGLADRVSLPGRAGNVGQWYEVADLYVMSSRFEGFPNTLAEAMAHGLPAVSFDCDTGPRDIIRNEVDGLLVPPGDVDALATALRRLMGDTALRAAFSARATDVRERFSLAHVADKWEQLFEELRHA